LGRRLGKRGLAQLTTYHGKAVITTLLTAAYQEPQMDTSPPERKNCALCRCSKMTMPAT